MHPNITKIIDQYLSGELTPEETRSFEERLESNPELQTEVQLQKDIIEGIKRAGITAQVKKTAKQYHTFKGLKWFWLSAGVVAIATAATLLLTPKSEELAAVITPDEEATFIAQMDSVSEFNTVLPQYFAIADSGDVVLSDEGVMISVPKKAFLKDGKPYEGNVIIQYQEALSAEDIMLAGLSTMSGKNLLETQGMVSLKGFTKDGELLEVNPEVGVYIQVPVDEHKEGMQLYNGVKDKDGLIDWQDPVPLEKIPVPVDMSELDFYPKGYEDKLDELKWLKNKKSRDSLYLSFEAVEAEEEQKSLSQTEESNNANDLVEAIVKEPKQVYWSARTWFKTKDVININFTANISAGYSLFAIDHDPAKFGGTGTPLTFSYPKMESFEKRGNTVQASASMTINMQPGVAEIHSGEAIFVQEIVSYNTKPFTIPVTIRYQVLTDSGVEAPQTEVIHVYVTPQAEEAAEAAVADSVECSYVSPSRVLGFWNEKFNNTNLATREFERRMQEVFCTGKDEVLAKYVNGLSKSISSIDQEVVAMGHPEFEKFVVENVGQVNPNNPHLDQLKEFYTSSIERLKKDAKDARAQESQRRKDFDDNVKKERIKDGQRDTQRRIQGLQEEYKFNLENVKKQLGPTQGFTLRYGTSNIKNIDKQVWDATVARTTSTIVDPSTGKTAQITYNDFAVSVKDASKYVQLYAYALPHELNSYQRLTQQNGSFSYSMNGDIKYDLAIIGFTEDGFEYFKKKGVIQNDNGEVALKPIAEDDLRRKLERLNKSKSDRVLSLYDEMTWLSTERENYVEQRNRMKMAAFRAELMMIISPCQQYVLTDVNGARNYVAIPM